MGCRDKVRVAVVQGCHGGGCGAPCAPRAGADAAGWSLCRAGALAFRQLLPRAWQASPGNASGITPGRITPRGARGHGCALAAARRSGSRCTFDASVRGLARHLCPPRARCCGWQEGSGDAGALGAAGERLRHAAALRRVLARFDGVSRRKLARGVAATVSVASSAPPAQDAVPLLHRTGVPWGMCRGFASAGS